MEKKQKRTLNTPVSLWEISDTYSGLPMSAILMNTPQNMVSGDKISQNISKELMLYAPETHVLIKV